MNKRAMSRKMRKRIMRINKKMKEKANSIQKTWRLQTSIVRWTDRKSNYNKMFTNIKKRYDHS